MTSTQWISLLNAGMVNQTSSGTAYASSTSATDVSPGANVLGQALTVPASYLQVGTQLRVRANGIVSTTGSPNLTLGVYWGGVAGTALASTGAIAASSGISNNTWMLSADIRVDAVGTNASIRTIGSVSGPYASFTLMPATSSSGNLVTGLDTSVAKILTIGATWGTNSASNTLTCYQFLVESLQF